MAILKKVEDSQIMLALYELLRVYPVINVDDVAIEIGLSVPGTYARLRKLRREGLVDSNWIPTQKGFESIERLHPLLATEKAFQFYSQEVAQL